MLVIVLSNFGTSIDKYSAKLNQGYLSRCLYNQWLPFTEAWLGKRGRAIRQVCDAPRFIYGGRALPLFLITKLVTPPEFEEISVIGEVLI